MLILVAPDETMPITRNIFHQQMEILDKAMLDDRRDMMRVRSAIA